MPHVQREAFDARWANLTDGRIDAGLVNETVMPPDLQEMRVQILCNDCHRESTVPFHVVGVLSARNAPPGTPADCDEDSPPLSLLQ